MTRAQRPDPHRRDPHRTHSGLTDRYVIDDEPGVPLERTSMAWQRTGLATVTVAVLLLHNPAGTETSWWPYLGALAAGLLMITTAAPLRYSRGGRAIIRGHESARPGWVLAAALAVAVLAGGIAAGVLLTDVV